VKQIGKNNEGDEAAHFMDEDRQDHEVREDLEPGAHYNEPVGTGGAGGVEEKHKDKIQACKSSGQYL
jgi:hypothetical protein